MPSPKRECASCQFFQNAQLAGNGWCTHPKRQLASDVRILVRSRELACRNSWGDDLWAEKSSHATTSNAHPDDLPAPFIGDPQHDDTVTSVVDTGSRLSVRAETGGDNDDRITHTAVRDDDHAPAPLSVDDINAPANDDQTDRVRIMARGNRDAILRARERAAQRRQPARPSIEPAAGDTIDEPVDPGVSSPLTETDSTVSRMAAYERTPPVPRDEVRSVSREASPAIGPDDRFDSVPPIRADVELPRLREFLRHEQPDREPSRTPLPDVSLSSYDHVLRRAQEIKTSTGRSFQQAGQASSRNSAPRPTPAKSFSQVPPTPEPDEPASERDLVWDLDIANLNVVFSRVRTVLDEEQARQDPRSSHNQEPAHDLPNEQPQSHMVEAFADEPFADDTFEATDTVIHRPPQPIAESPRSSWWRSLNFGIRRRVSADIQSARTPYRPSPADDAPWAEYDDDTLIYDHHDEPDAIWFDEDAGSIAGESDRVAAMSHFADTFTDDDAGDDQDDRLITTEASWLHDETQFPEVQPAAWREQRAALLAQSPLSEDVPLPPVPSLPQTVPPARPDPGPVVRSPAPAESRRTYHVEDPGGFIAFREALFATDAPTHPPETSRPEPITATSGWDDDFEPPAYVDDQVTMPPVMAKPSRSTRQHSTRVSDRELRAAFTDQEDVAQRFEVASAVRKCCRTCRSFQPSDNQEQGRCGNAWAYTHRQLVNADVLSCHSSIGDWWLADDLAWIPPDTAIVPETPYTDRLEMRQRGENEPATQDGQRVRTRRSG